MDEFELSDDMEPPEEEFDIIAEIGEMDSDKFGLADGVVDDVDLPMAHKGAKKTKAKDKKLTQRDLMKDVDEDEIE